MLLLPETISFLKSKDICLIGFMGAGKTFFGEHLSKETGHILLDTDSLIETKTQQTISEIFKQKGEKHFRLLEKTVLQDIIYADTEQKRIICTGGGLPIPRLNQKLIKQLGSFNICLNPPFETIYQRIRSAPLPPLRRGATPPEFTKGQSISAPPEFTKGQSISAPPEFTKGGVGGGRPLIYRRSRKYIFSLWASRYPEYQKIAHITISETTIEDIFDTLNERIKLLLFPQGQHLKKDKR